MATNSSISAEHGAAVVKTVRAAASSRSKVCAARWACPAAAVVSTTAAGEAVKTEGCGANHRRSVGVWREASPSARPSVTAHADRWRHGTDELRTGCETPGSTP